MLKMEPGDEEILKEGKVDFYTISYYVTNCASSDPESAVSAGNPVGGFKNPYLKVSE